ncbi:MAG: hypothetical protein D6714_19570 [Bacteroidetes bacterium]|nr:MAG: hypothetical protein D6714_19570 [Bacteroidota bacterium]
MRVWLEKVCREGLFFGSRKVPLQPQKRKVFFLRCFEKPSKGKTDKQRGRVFPINSARGVGPQYSRRQEEYLKKTKQD